MIDFYWWLIIFKIQIMKFSWNLINIYTLGSLKFQYLPVQISNVRNLSGKVIGCALSSFPAVFLAVRFISTSTWRSSGWQYKRENTSQRLRHSSQTLSSLLPFCSHALKRRFCGVVTARVCDITCKIFNICKSCVLFATFVVPWAQYSLSHAACLGRNIRTNTWNHNL